MSWTLLRATLHQRRTATLWYALGLTTYSVFIVWYFPTIQKIDIASYMEQFPKELVTFFAGSAASLSTLGGYLATEYLGFIWVLIIAAAGITFATKSLSSEIDAGTMELILSQPISRKRFASTRAFALALFLAIQLLATTVPIWLTALAIDVEVDVGNLAVLTAGGFLLALAISGVAFLLSSASRESGKPAAILGGILSAMWILHFMAANAKWAEALESVNLFKYWQPADLVESGTMPSEAWWVLGGVAVASLVASVFVFSRRDVT
jgi:ABC-2 type transport system permease protein